MSVLSWPGLFPVSSHGKSSVNGHVQFQALQYAPLVGRQIKAEFIRKPGEVMG